LNASVLMPAACAMLGVGQRKTHQLVLLTR